MHMNKELTNMTTAAFFKRFSWLASATVILGAAAPAAHAEAGNPLTDTVSVSLGGFLLDTKTKLRVNGDIRTGDEIDADKDLGLKDSDRFRFDGYWRMTPRQKIRVMYFNTDNSNTRTLNRTIEIGDNSYPVNLEVNAGVKTTVGALSYEFDFWHSDKYELGLIGGIHNLKFNFHINATANSLNASESNTAQANGPLPLIGIHGVWRWNEKFFLDAGGQFLKINYDPYNGRFTDYTASFNWQATKNFAVGAGWNSFVTKVDVSGSQFDGSLRWAYGGMRVFVTGSF
jgi:hypothetical protein